MTNQHSRPHARFWAPSLTLLARLACAGITAGAAVVAAPASAHACSCQPYAVSVPANGATGVPINTRVLWSDGFWRADVLPELSLHGPDGVVAVQLSSAPMEAGLLAAVLTPTSPLAPQATYALKRGTRELLSFTTGGARDEAPPSAPTATPNGCAYDPVIGTCSTPTRLASYDVARPDALLVVGIGDDPPAPSFAPGGASSTTGRWFIAALASGGPVQLGLGECRETVAEGATISFGALDSAGNFSGWRQVGPLDLPDAACQEPTPPATSFDGGASPPDSAAPPHVVTDEPRGGCSVAGRAGPTDALFASALVYVAALLRRRRRR